MKQHGLSELVGLCYQLFCLCLSEVVATGQAVCQGSCGCAAEARQGSEDLHANYNQNRGSVFGVGEIKIITQVVWMQFGGLTTYEQMQKYYQKMRATSRAQLLSSIYKNYGKAPDTKIQKDLTQTFLAITNNYNFSTNSPVVQEILNLFDIKAGELENKSVEQRETYLNRKILDCIEEKLKKLPSNDEVVEYSVKKDNPQNNQFDWVGVKSNFANLRSIFQQILLEKVRQFDEELSRLTQMTYITQESRQDFVAATTARTQTFRTTKTTFSEPKNLSKISSGTYSVRKFQKEIEKKGFTNVLIRDHSQFSLSKWTKKQEREFQSKKKQFRVNFRKNGYETPIIFQFVKKYTTTVKARDNIYQKWQNRQKSGISSEQLKYLCSTSLFLNQTINKSEKDRINKNIKSLGKELISKLEFNIAEKIIETYKQFMKKVADLRAHYYEELTQKRKHQYDSHNKKQQLAHRAEGRKKQFLKFKHIFQNICNSQRMKIVLNPRVYRWVRLFIRNLKQTYEVTTGNKLYKNKKKNVFSRLFLNHHQSEQLLKSKIKYPSARVIKRQDIGTMKQPMKKYIPTQRFFYQSSFQKRIKTLNSIKIKSQRSFMKQISGGPRNVVPESVTINLQRKQIVLTSAKCLRFIIKIQAKWRAVRQRKRYLSILENYREQMEIDFQERIKSLKYIYPFGYKLNIKAIEDRLKRVSMRTLNILKPYVRVSRKPINNYTSFSQANFSLAQLKSKQSKNSARRLAQFGKMVEHNEYNKLLKSGFVVTAKEINDPLFKDGANAMWWAVKNCNLDLTRIFLEGGGNPNSKNFENNTCMHQAIQNGDVQIIFLLLDYGADLNLKNNKKVTPLYYATPKMLKLLGLEEGVVSCENSMRDNNSTFFKPPTTDSFYPDHYY